jgi:hypothetical protein
MNIIYTKSKYIFVFLVTIIFFSYLNQLSSQRIFNLSANIQDGVIGLDRKAFGGPYSQGYHNDFNLGASISPCEKIVSIALSISASGATTGTIPPDCVPVGPVYFNIYYGCNPYSGPASCPDASPPILAAPNFPYAPSGNPSFNQTYSCNNTNFEFGGNFSVDVVPVWNTFCTNGQNPIPLGYVAFTGTITLTVTTELISCTGTGCLAPGPPVMLPCDDGNPCTINDVQGVLACDLSTVCVPCMGTPSGTPPTPTFTQLGPYCQNATPDVLPTSSTNVPPILGTWSPAVINTAITGSQVYTFTPNPGECGTSTTMTITVTPNVLPTFTQLGPYCQNATPDVLPTSSTNAPPILGTWSPAVINTTIPGSQVYTFTPNPGECGTSTTMTVTVTPNILPTFTQLGPYCQNSTPGILPINSTNSPPITGTWSPAIINTAIAGTSNYTFTPDPNQCALPTIMPVVITSSVFPDFTQLGPYCQNGTPDVLPSISNDSPPITGTWSPAIINTAIAGTSNYTFTPDPNQCALPTIMPIVITSSVVPDFTQLGPYCQNATPDLLPSISNDSPPITGTWSPAVINTSTVGSTIYTFTPAPNQCGLPTNMTIVVSNSVTPTFTQLGPYCLNATPGVLPLISTNGIAGTWSPSVVNTSTVGSSTYTFTPAAGSCGSSTTMSITVTNSVLPTFTQLGPFCLNATPGLLPLISTNGIAGTWSPSVVNTSTVGSATYTFTPAAGSCGSSTTMSITVTNSVLPTFTQLGPYCLNATPGLLPLISTNGIAGTWSPSVVNTSTVGSANLYIYTSCRNLRIIYNHEYYGNK